MLKFSSMDALSTVIDFILHIDVHLNEIVSSYGTLTYLILFLIVTAETGFVVTPFLPGDSLLFAAGAIAALGALDITTLVLLLFVAAVLGDTLNYSIGHFFGQKIVNNPKIPFINQEHIDKTEQFYKKHGGKTIILARFTPIVRTFAPFVAGVGKMHYSTFITYNIVGGALWVSLFTLAGYFFGNMPIVKENFHIVIFTIIGLSLVPMAYEFIQNRRHPNQPSVPQKTLEEVVNK